MRTGARQLLGTDEQPQGAGSRIDPAPDGTAVAAASASAPETPSLRDQHHQLTRELILRSVAEQLEVGEVSDITVPEVARAAGVSVRTVYRHFPTREELLAGASEWIGDRLFGHQLPDRIEDLTASLRVNFANFDEHPNLVRAMALSRAGNLVRSPRRQRRLENQNHALLAVTSNLPEGERRQAEAVFGYLVNMLAWVTMRDENGLSGTEIGRRAGLGPHRVD